MDNRFSCLKPAFRLAIMAALMLSLPTAASAGVQVIKGASPIIGAEAANPQDITLMNDKLAVTFSVASDVPWGVPAGGILDIAPVKNGKPGRDQMTLVDFIPNNWSNWPATKVQFSTDGSTAEKAVLDVRRTWGDVELQTTYTLAQNSDRLDMKAVMTNKGKDALNDLLSGFVMWPEGGALLQPTKSGVVSRAGSGALDMDAKANKFTVAYSEDWAIALHAPYASVINYEGKDLYMKHSLASGASQTFVAQLQVSSTGESVPALLAWDKAAPGQLSGTAKANGQPLKDLVVVVEQNGELVAWAQGRDGKFAFNLPSGEYDVYATGKGYLPSAKSRVIVKAGETASRDFTDLKAPGTLKFQIRDEAGKPVAARLSIEKGSQPPVRFLGARTFFTELVRPGDLEVSLAPGDYTFRVNSGWPFVSKARDVVVNVASGTSSLVPVDVPTMFRPADKGWVSVDLHHHSDLLDGVTPAEFLVRSQVAARLDYLFLSDHDTIDNLKVVAGIAKKHGFRFIPGLEISPSWAHFNVMPVSLDRGLGVNPANATATEIFKAARELGAQVIVANHPMISYGYLNSLDNNKIPGGFDPGFDNFEVNSDGKYLQAIPRIWEYWTRGQFYPFTAGTDIHDVWNYVSGRNRLYIQKGNADPNDLTALLAQMKAGRAFVSMGPLVYPRVMYGETISHKAGDELVLTFDVAAVDGLKDVVLISEGKPVETRTLNKETEATVTFAVKPGKDTWYAVTVTDAAERPAWTNPVFVKMR